MACLRWEFRGARSFWLMDWPMAARKNITKAQVLRYRNRLTVVESEIPDMCQVTGDHRGHARRAMRLALTLGGQGVGSPPVGSGTRPTGSEPR